MFTSNFSETLQYKFTHLQHQEFMINEKMNATIIVSTKIILHDLTNSSDFTTLGQAGQVMSFQNALINPDIFSKASDIIEKLVSSLQAIGLVLNIINIIIFSRLSKQSSPTTYLMALSITEIIYILIDLIEPIYNLFAILRPTSYFYLFYGLIMNNYMMSCLGRYMYCLICFISLERLLAITFPLHAKQFKIAQNPFLFIITTFILQIVCHIHVCLKYEFYEIQSSGQSMAAIQVQGINDTTLQTQWTFRKSKIYISNYKLIEDWGVVVNSVFVYAVLGLAIVMNILLIISLRHHTHHSRKTMTSSIDAVRRNRLERQTTITVLTSTFIFVLLSLPLHTNAFISRLMPERHGYFTPERYTFLFFQSFGVMCFILSFSTDFTAHIILSSAYRSTVNALLSHISCFGEKMTVKKKDGSKGLTSIKNPALPGSNTHPQP